MRCVVYKGHRKPDHYLYLPQEFDPSETELPKALIEMLGDLSLVLEFDLDEARTLPQADAAQVMNDLMKQGFYLQLPKKDMVAEENEWFN